MATFPAGPGTGSDLLPRLLSALLLAAPVALSAAGDPLDPLREVVESACACAAGQASGMEAAVRCTEGPRAFGSLKVIARDAFTAAQREEAAVLERVLETCIANALDHATARRRLGLAATPGAPGTAPMVWVQIRVEDLPAYPQALARIHTADGADMKGMVARVSADALHLRRARRDGGGETRIPIAAIREAWVMRLP